MDISMILIVAGQVLCALLLVYLGFPVIRRQTTVEAKVATTFVLLLFFGLLVGMAYSTYLSAFS